MESQNNKTEFAFVKEPFVSALLTFLFATPFFALLTIAGLAHFVGTLANEVIGTKNILLISVSIAKCLGILLFCCFTAILAILPLKNFRSISWLYKGKLLVLEKAMELHGNSKKVRIPYHSIVHIATRPNMSDSDYSSRRGWLLLVWRGQRGLVTFRLYQNWFKKGAFEELASLLKGGQNYVEEPETVREIFRKLRLNRITFSWLFKRWHQIEDGIN